MEETAPPQSASSCTLSPVSSHVSLVRTNSGRSLRAHATMQPRSSSCRRKPATATLVLILRTSLVDTSDRKAMSLLRRSCVKPCLMMYWPEGYIQSLGRCCAMPLGTAHLKLHPVLSMLLPALPTVALPRYHFELQGPALWAELSERGNHLVV